MIVVVGRPHIDERGTLIHRAGRVAAAAAMAGAKVEVVGSVADDADGDATITQLGRAGIGHAALLRMPASGQPRLDAADIELGLRYVSDCHVLVVADVLDAAALAAAVDGARYHGAALVVAAEADSASAFELPAEATVLASPGNDDEAAFADLVGRYAAQLDAGRAPADAWRAALTATGWEQTTDDPGALEL